MRSIFILSYFILAQVISYAQQNENEKITENQSLEVVNNAQATLTYSFDQYTIKKSIQRGVIIYKLDMGENHISDPNIPFVGSLTMDFQTTKDGSIVNVLDRSSESLTINQAEPVSYFIMNLQSLVENTDGDDNLPFDELTVTISNAQTPIGYYGQSMRLNLSSEIELALDVENLSSTVSGVELNNEILVSQKMVNFKWQDSHPISKYQIQILRLENTSSSTSSEQHDITAILDWSKAMTYQGTCAYDQTEDMKSFALTLAEGSGYYTFRVRPVGSYYHGGNGSAKNAGQWSAHDANGTSMNINMNNVSLPYFYFTDPDEDRNWIYNRVFTENSRVKESLTFANGLLQPRQTQTYLPSQDVTIVTQSILDYSGRPAVSTIPIPLAGRKNKYQEQLVKASDNNELYTAKNFDTDDNFDNPMSTVPFGYYNNNLDKGIPNDNGFGFTRAIYYNESSSRVREQSGVGEIHKIGGKTTRSLYSTASEDELITLFGDEAPDSESVMKSITVDANGVASVTYTSKEGNVIATSLSLYQEDINLLELDEPVSSVPVTDKITQNSKSSNGFISSKRISLLQDNPNFSVSYSIECLEFEQLCQVATLDCDYQLEISLIELGTNGEVNNRQLLISESLADLTCQPINDKEYKIVNLITPIALSAGNYIVEKRLKVGEASLAISENTKSIDAQVSPLSNLIASWLESIDNTTELHQFNKSLYNLSQAIENQSLETFTNASFPNFPVGLSSEFFTEVYNDKKDQFILSFQPDTYNPFTTNQGENPLSFVLGTPCCTISIPVKWIPPFDCESESALVDSNGNGKLDVVNYLELFNPSSTVETEFLPDFEGYALAFMSDCIGPDFVNEQALKDVMYGIYMTGWGREGTFNMMVYHMLNDKYNTNNTFDQEPSNDSQYDCDRLLACWDAQLSRLKDEICTKFNFYQDQGRESVSSAYDEEYEEDDRDGKYDKNHDDHFDDNFKGGFFLTRWLAKRKISRRMRNLQAGGEESSNITPKQGQFHMIKEFLECTGYQFAKVITPYDATPLEDDEDSQFLASTNGYRVANDVPPIPFKINHSYTEESYFDGKNYIDPSLDYGYVPLSNWDPKKRAKNRNTGNFELTDKSLFPNIKNPIYAFKYFEYVDEFQNDKSIYQNLEMNVCYADPNDCYQLDGGFIVVDSETGLPIKVPCCNSTASWNAEGCYADTNYPGLNSAMVGFGTNAAGDSAKYVVSEFCERGRVVCTYTHEDWSSGQRLTFYNLIKHYVIPENDAWNDLDPYELTCDDLDTDSQWYVNVDPSANDSPTLVNAATYGNYPSEDFRQLYLGDGSSTFKYVELEIESRISECNSGCDRKRQIFENRLVAMLISKCYEIGGCRTAEIETHHVIPEEDIARMVDAMIEACKQQCNLTTYSCDAAPCRSIDRPQIYTGHDENEFRMNYGMGGYDPAFCDDTSYTYSDASNCLDADGDGIYECDLLNPVTGDFYDLSWYEYTKLKQVKEWDFDIDMPTKCLDTEGNPIPTDNDLACCGADPNTSIGDTFVPKDLYEVNSNDAFDSNKPDVGEQVKSPTIGINVKVEPGNN